MADEGSDAPGFGRRGYHHGALREALIDAARARIKAQGVAGLKLGDVAREVGVAASAPYRHFADKDALVSAVLTADMQSFAQALHRARRDPALTPLQALDAVMRVYLQTARRDPASFMAMFERGAAYAADPGAEADAFAALLGAVVAVLDAAPPERRPPPLMTAHHLWTLCHGAASLFAAPDRPAPADPDALLEAAAAVYLRGLGLLPMD